MDPPIEQNEQRAEVHLVGVWNDGEFDRVPLADDFRVHTNFGAHREHSLDQFRRYVAQAREWIPDIQITIDNSIANEAAATVEYSMTGTQQGKVLGIPPTGRPVEINGVAVYRFDGRAIGDVRYVADFLRLARQLGVFD